MSRLAVAEPAALPRGEAGSARRFALAAATLAVAAAFLAGWLPIQFSIVTVFLFAGPHNWFDALSSLARLPGRWGKLRGFFLFAFGGIFVLTTSFMALRWWLPIALWESVDFSTVLAGWNSAVLLWVVVLVQWRSRQNPRRDWFWT